MITLESWQSAGYKQYEVYNRQTQRLADFILQRRYDDEVGKKYFITVYCYDRGKYPEPHRTMYKDTPFGFMPTVQFQLGDGKPFFEVEMNAVEQLNSIAEIEEWFEKFWNLFDKPYYEKFE